MIGRSGWCPPRSQRRVQVVDVAERSCSTAAAGIQAAMPGATFCSRIGRGSLPRKRGAPGAAFLAEHGRDDGHGLRGFRWRSPFEAQPLVLAQRQTPPRRHAPSGPEHPLWLKTGAPTAIRMYQMGLPDSPMRVVSTMTNAGDPPRTGRDGGSTWLLSRIPHSRVRRTAARAGWTKCRPWLRPVRARRLPSPTPARLSVPGGRDPKDPSGGSSSSVILSQSHWPGGFRCSSSAGCVRTSR